MWRLIILSLSLTLFAGCGRPKSPRSAHKSKAGPSVTKTKKTTAPSTKGKTGDQTPKTSGTNTKTPESATGFAALSQQQQARGAALYEANCQACHGKQGAGDGTAARYLFPRPRDFRAGRFRLVSTVNGVPTSDDLVSVLKRGMPGSAMPPWPNLSDEDRKLLAARVLEFRRDEVRRVEKKLAADDGEELTPEELEKIVARRTTPGAPVVVPPLEAPTPDAIVRGKELYLKKGCAACHGKTGKGDGQQKMVDAKGLPTSPRDLTLGIFKGNPDPHSVYIRTQAGMPGSPMPATRELTPKQIGDLVQFALSLSDEATRAKAVLNRERIVAVSVKKAPTTPGDAAWKNATPAHIRMTPLWWRNNYPAELNVQAAYDGQSISLRLSWADPTADKQAAQSATFGDKVAVELYRGKTEPFLGMGSAKNPVDVWLWDADRQNGSPDVDRVHPRIVVDRYPLTEQRVVTSAEFKRPGTATKDQAAVSLPAKFSGNQIVPKPGEHPVESLQVGGPGSVTFRPPINQSVRSAGVWKAGRWSVVLIRKLASDSARGGISLKPGDHVSAAFAVWDGSQHDRDGKKTITIWQDLILGQAKQ